MQIKITLDCGEATLEASAPHESAAEALALLRDTRRTLYPHGCAHPYDSLNEAALALVELLSECTRAVEDSGLDSDADRAYLCGQKLAPLAAWIRSLR